MLSRYAVAEGGEGEGEGGYEDQLLVEFMAVVAVVVVEGGGRGALRPVLSKYAVGEGMVQY